MERYPHRNSSSGLAVFAVLTLVFLAILVAVFAMAGVWYLRATQSRQEALVLRDQAIAQQKLAEAAAEQARSAASSAPVAAMTSIVVSLNSDGHVLLDEQVISIDDLKAHLDQQVASSKLRIQIKVHEQCPATAVVQVSQVCTDAGIENVELDSL